MSEDFAFTLSRRGTHVLAGRTVLQLVPALDTTEADGPVIDVAGALAESNARALVAARRGRWSASCRRAAASGSISRPDPRIPSPWRSPCAGCGR